MGIFNEDKVTSKNAKAKAMEKMGSTDAVGYQSKAIQLEKKAAENGTEEDRKNYSETHSEEARYGKQYMADVYVDVKNDDNVTMLFKLPDKTELDAKNAYHNRGGDVLPHAMAEIVGQKSMAYFNDLGATSLSFQNVGLLKGAVEEPSSKAAKGGTIFNFRLTGDELAGAFTYINAKRSHSYTPGFNSATFASHALKAAGINVGIHGIHSGSSSEFRKKMFKETIKGNEEKWEQTAIKTDQLMTDEVKYMAKSEADSRRKGAVLDKGWKTKIGAGKWQHLGIARDNNHTAFSNEISIEDLYTNLIKADYTTASGQERLSQLRKADIEIDKKESDEHKTLHTKIHKKQVIDKHHTAIRALVKQFKNARDVQSANDLLIYLEENCSDAEARKNNYLDDEKLKSWCGLALLTIAFDKSLNFGQDVCERSKQLLNSFAPNSANEASYNNALKEEENRKKLKMQEKEKEVNNTIDSLKTTLLIYKQARGVNSYDGAKEFLERIEYYIIDGKQCLYPLTFDLLKDNFGRIIQEIAYIKSTLIPDTIRNRAISILKAIAPEFNDSEDYSNYAGTSNENIKEESYIAHAKEFSNRAKTGLKNDAKAFEIFGLIDKAMKTDSTEIAKNAFAQTLRDIAFDKSIKVEATNRAKAVDYMSKLGLIVIDKGQSKESR
jgi:uncharacterized protein YbcI